MNRSTEEQLLDLDRLVRHYEIKKHFRLKSTEGLEKEWRFVRDVAVQLGRDLNAGLEGALNLACLAHCEQKVKAKSDRV